MILSYRHVLIEEIKSGRRLRMVSRALFFFPSEPQTWMIIVQRGPHDIVMLPNIHRSRLWWRHQAPSRAIPGAAPSLRCQRAERQHACKIIPFLGFPKSSFARRLFHPPLIKSIPKVPECETLLRRLFLESCSMPKCLAPKYHLSGLVPLGSIVELTCNLLLCGSLFPRCKTSLHSFSLG